MHFILFTSSDTYGGYIRHLIWTLHLKLWTHFLILGLGLSVHFIWALHLKLGGISDSLSEHFFWKYELISSFWVWVSVCTSSEHFIWKWGGISESEHFIWKFGSQCALHLKPGGVYLNLNTSSENLSSRTFRCGHHRDLFASRKTNKRHSDLIIDTHIPVT